MCNFVAISRVNFIFFHSTDRANLQYQTVRDCGGGGGSVGLYEYK
jgi:hypothetical protein